MVSSTLTQSNSQRGWFDVLDDWLKRDRFVFVGWSGLLLHTLLVGGREMCVWDLGFMFRD